MDPGIVFRTTRKAGLGCEVESSYERFRPMRWSTVAVVSLILLVTACREEAVEREVPSEPAAAVAAWLAAVDQGDFQEIVDLIPPGMTAEEKKALSAEMESRLHGMSRDDHEPFGMSEPREGRTTARVHLIGPEGRLSLSLHLEEHDGRWYSRPVFDSSP